jgi:hypothetical protein
MNLPPNLNEVVEYVEHNHPKGVALAARALVELSDMFPQWRDPILDPPTGDAHRDILVRIKWPMGRLPVAVWTWRPSVGLSVDVHSWMEIPQ